MRYLPLAERSNDMFGWHHDMEEKRFKVMILLTDVGPDDQHMSYVLGSQKPFHPYEMFFKNAYPLKRVRKLLPEIKIFDCTGKAGDMFLFDTNGSHRGRRRETGRVRDVFLVEYSADRTGTWGGDVDLSAFDGLALPGYNPFDRILAAQKKWDQPLTRQAPTWVESLPNVEAWL